MSKILSLAQDFGKKSK
ncbi:MbeB family mobilization protein, partial [Vibrio anguillarum]